MSRPRTLIIMVQYTLISREFAELLLLQMLCDLFSLTVQLERA